MIVFGSGVVPTIQASAAGPTGSGFGLALGGTDVAPTTVSGTLWSGPQLGITPSSFFGVVAQTSTRTGISTDASVGKYLNSTPFVTYTFTQESDHCNITSNQQYSDSGTVTGGCGFSVSSVKAWCGSRAATCSSILVLPGENNNSREDGNMANYVYNTLHYQPAYFAIGNEPELWTHYGKAWTSWKTSDNIAPTATAYAFDVKAGIKAVRSVDPTAHFIGIESDCSCTPTWFAAVAKIDGPNLSAIAYHSYPSAAGQTNVNPTQFFAPLAGNTNLSASYAQVRASIAKVCIGCKTLPILVTEYNSGPGWAPSNLAGSWDDAVFLAASTAQALWANVSMFSVFHLQSDSGSFSWSLLNSQGTSSPAGLLFSSLLSHLQLGAVNGVRVATSAGNIWSVLTTHGRNHTLLVVDANAAKSIQLALNSVLHVRAGTTPTIYAWSGAAGGPTVTNAALASTYTIPSQGILMIDYSS